MHHADNDKWTREELRITVNQANFLSGWSSSVFQKVENNTEDSLAKRGMLKWNVVGGEYKIAPTPKGIAALNQFYGRDKNAA